MSEVFKPGDRVVRVRSGFGKFTPGDAGIVSRCRGANLEFAGDGFVYDPTFFKLVTPAAEVPAPKPPPEAAPAANPLDTQVGGRHYKDYAIQPIEYSMANKLDACQHSVVKYVTRFRDKGAPIKDLEKARHFIDMLIAFETAKQSPVTPKA